MWRALVWRQRPEWPPGMSRFLLRTSRTVSRARMLAKVVLFLFLLHFCKQSVWCIKAYSFYTSRTSQTLIKIIIDIKLTLVFFVVCLSGRQLLLKAVNRVWTELMHGKRQMLEDIFKVSLPVNDRGHVDIATARPALEEPAAKSWQNHLGEENIITRSNGLLAYSLLLLHSFLCLCTLLIFSLMSLTVLNLHCFSSSPWEEMHQ